MDTAAFVASYVCDKYFYECPPSLEIQSLTDLCAKKLVSDISLCRNISGLPKTIHLRLLLKAVSEVRVLAIAELLKDCKYEAFTLPFSCYAKNKGRTAYLKYENVPDFIKFSLLNLEELTDLVKHMKQIGKVVVDTFISISEQDCSSKLHVVDLSLFPMGVSSWKKTWILISKAQKKHAKQNILKLGVTLEANENFEQLIKIKSDDKWAVIKLVITALHIHYVNLREGVFLKLLEKLDTSELCMLSLQFSGIYPSAESTFIKLRKFCNLKILILRYVRFDFTVDQNLLHTFSQTLHDLVHLSILNLQECRLTGCLKVIFQQFCKQNYQIKKQRLESDENCCIIHRRKLYYLNISDCSINSQDFACLAQSPLAETLKYLFINGNNISILSFSQLFLAVKGNLEILELSSCLPADSLLSPLFPKFSSMKKLRHLDLMGLAYNEDCLLSLANEFKKLENLKSLILTRPLYKLDNPVTAYTEEDIDRRMKMVEDIINDKKYVYISWKE